MIFLVNVYFFFINLHQELFSCVAVFFPEVGGSTLDSHHGFVVEYGKDKDVELGK